MTRMRSWFSNHDADSDDMNRAKSTPEGKERDRLSSSLAFDHLKFEDRSLFVDMRSSTSVTIDSNQPTMTIELTQINDTEKALDVDIESTRTSEVTLPFVVESP